MGAGAIRIITLDKMSANLFTINQNLSSLYQKRLQKFCTMRVYLIETIAEEKQIPVCEVANLPANTVLDIKSFRAYNDIIDEFCTLD
ncbi:MAG: hypothetical protein KAT32_03315 [Candidatus Moranbacteria bacterium]|nr:hypothetical protein [Candidatus Moranbacteria bacterium]